MKGPSCLDSSHLGSLAGHSVASGASLRTFSRAAGRDGVAVPVVVAQPEWVLGLCLGVPGACVARVAGCFHCALWLHALVSGGHRPVC